MNLQAVKLSLMSLSLEAVKMLENMNVDAEKEKQTGGFWLLAQQTCLTGNANRKCAVFH